MLTYYLPFKDFFENSANVKFYYVVFIKRVCLFGENKEIMSFVNNDYVIMRYLPANRCPKGADNG